MEVVKANEKMLTESKQWREDVQAVAMVTSCISEFIAMQTAIDKEVHRAHAHLATELDDR